MIGLLNLKESENGFCVPFLNRLIQDFLDHGASKEPKKSKNSSVPLTHYDLRDLGLVCLAKESKICFHILSDWRIQSFYKEMHPKLWCEWGIGEENSIFCKLTCKFLSSSRKVENEIWTALREIIFF